MASLTPQANGQPALYFVAWTGPTTPIATASWKAGVAGAGGIFQVNATRAAYISYKSASSFPAVTAVQAGGIYLWKVSSVIDVPDAHITVIDLSATPAPANQAPAVSLSLSSSTITAGQPVTLTATATDGDGTIAKVEFFNGPTPLATDFTNPFTYVFTPAAPGSYALTARATDNAGAVTISSALTLTVNAAVPVNAGGKAWVSALGNSNTAGQGVSWYNQVEATALTGAGTSRIAWPDVLADRMGLANITVRPHGHGGFTADGLKARIAEEVAAEYNATTAAQYPGGRYVVLQEGPNTADALYAANPTISGADLGTQLATEMRELAQEVKNQAPGVKIIYTAITPYGQRPPAIMDGIDLCNAAIKAEAGGAVFDKYVDMRTYHYLRTTADIALGGVRWTDQVHFGALPTMAMAYGVQKALTTDLSAVITTLAEFDPLESPQPTYTGQNSTSRVYTFNTAGATAAELLYSTANGAPGSWVQPTAAMVVSNLLSVPVGNGAVAINQVQVIRPYLHDGAAPSYYSFGTAAMDAAATVTPTELTSPAVTGKYKVLFDGDSITAGYGQGSDVTTDSYPAQTKLWLGTTNFGAFLNFGSPGSSVDGIIANDTGAGGLDSAIPDAAYAGAIAAMLGGVNCWLREGGETTDNSRPDHVIQELTLWHNGRQAAGARTVAATILNVGAKPGEITNLAQFNANIDYVNTWIRANYSTVLKAAALCDFAADARLDPRTPTGAANYITDLLHPNAQGAKVMGELMAPKIRLVASQPVAAAPAPVLQFAYADNAAEGLETNMPIIANYGSLARGNNVFISPDASAYAALTVETTQFKVQVPRTPDGSDFSITVTDGAGAVVASATASCYAAALDDVFIAWTSAVLPRARYTVRVQNLVTNGGKLYFDTFLYESSTGDLSLLSFVDHPDQGILTNMGFTGGYERLNVANGSLFYGVGLGKYAEFTTPVACTQLAIRSIHADYGSHFTVLIDGQPAGGGDLYAAAEQNASIVYDSGVLPAAVHTIRMEWADGSIPSQTMLLDGFYYKPA